MAQTVHQKRLQHLTTALASGQPQPSQPRRSVERQPTTVLAVTAAGSAAPLGCLDYAYSFITGSGPENAIRFWIESKTTLYDDRHGTTKVFYQCASCKSEDTFGKGLALSGKLLFQVRVFLFIFDAKMENLPLFSAFR